MRREILETAKLNKTLQTQASYQARNDRSAAALQEMKIEREDKKLEQFTRERRRLRGKSLAFWYENDKKWNISSDLHPAVVRAKSAKEAEAPLTARTGLAKELSRQRSQVGKGKMERSVPGHPSASDPKQQSKTSVRDLSFEERLRRQTRKEDRAAEYLRDETLNQSSVRQVKAHDKRIKKEDIDARRLALRSTQQQNHEAELAVYSDRHESASRVREHLRCETVRRKELQSYSKREQMDKSLLHREEEEEGKRAMETVRMQRLASRLARRTVLSS